MKKFKTIIAVCLVAVVSLCCGIVLTACGTPDPTASINGCVVDGNSNAIAGAVVTVGDKTVTTGEDGVYEFTGLAYETFTVKATKEGYFEGSVEFKQEELSLLDEKQNVYGGSKDITIVQSGVINGTVTDAQKNAVAGAKVVVGETEVTTDAQGKYTVKNLDTDANNGKYTVNVTAEGFYGNKATASFGRKFEATANVTLAKIGKVVVTVVGADGKTPIDVNASVKVGTAAAKTATPTANAVTFGEGDRTAVGANAITVTAEGYVDFTAEITASDFDTATPPTYAVTAVMEKEFLPGIGMEAFMTSANAKVITDKVYRTQYYNGTGDDAKVLGYTDETDIRNKWAISKSGGTATHQEGMEFAGSGDGKATAEFLYTYIYGKTTIAAANSMLTVSGRRYDTNEPALLSAYVITYKDATTLNEPVALKVAGTEQTTAAINTYYSYASFDLSEYIGKEIIIVLGNKKSQFNLNMIQFTDATEDFMTNVDGVKLSTLKALAPTLKDTDGNVFVQNSKSSNGIVSKFATVGRVENLNEGAACTYGEREHLDDADATKLHDFVYGKKTLTGITSIVVKARTFAGQVTDHGTLSPKLAIVLVKLDGDVATLVGTQTVDADADTDYTFALNGVEGDYLVLIGSMNGYHCAISSITFANA